MQNTGTNRLGWREEEYELWGADATLQWLGVGGPSATYNQESGTQYNFILDPV